MSKRREAARQRVIAAVQRPGWHYGLDVMREAKVLAGTASIILGQLEEQGLVRAEWVGSDYPRRRQYMWIPQLCNTPNL